MGRVPDGRTKAGPRPRRPQRTQPLVESPSVQMERVGVATVDAVFSSMGWAFREQPVADQGIDALVEVDGLTRPTGRYLAVQIKCGRSYFRPKSSNGWTFTGKPRHLSYWLAHLMPVILVLVDPDTRVAYWVHVTHLAVRYTERSWSIQVPAKNVLDEGARDTLQALAFSATPASTDPVDEALPLLPASAVEMPTALRRVDVDGALRLAKFLTEGRHEPRSTVETLLDASGTWPHATALRLATIGAYANEHGHQDLAMTAFALADEKDDDNRARLSGIAALMALDGRSGQGSRTSASRA